MFKYALRLAYILRPSIVYEIIKRQLAEIIPLNKLLGIEVTSIGDGTAQARLAFHPEVTNHIGSMHATAIFGLAEAASGGALSGAFAPVVLDIRPVAVSARVDFLKVARSDLVAGAATSIPPETLRATLAASGKVVFDVTVEIRDSAAADIGRMTVSWHVTKKAAKAPAAAVASR
ncbi:MAG TPA: DUF4442 domain-containing protein [Rhizomicrobium sp.]|nr:DUF4442 domain-containing protein [Rhizomicrobium sp.]